MPEALPVAFVQVAVALLLIGLFYFVRRARGGADSFKKFSGLFVYLPREKLEFVVLVAALLAYALALTLALIEFSPEYAKLAMGPTSLYGRFAHEGWAVRPLVNGILVAVFQTALSEEIFFRGLVAKSFIRFFGFTSGNLLQALVFAAIHNLMFYGGLHTFFSLSQALIFAMVFFPALVMCWYNEQKAAGSILPSWIIHATLNLVSFFALVYFANRH